MRHQYELKYVSGRLEVITEFCMQRWETLKGRLCVRRWETIYEVKRNCFVFREGIESIEETGRSDRKTILRNCRRKSFKRLGKLNL